MMTVIATAAVLIVAFFMVAVTLLLIFARLGRRIRRRQTAEMLALMDNLDELRRLIIVVTSPEIKGMSIENILGPVSGLQEERVSGKGAFTLLEHRAFHAMLAAADELGANAVVDVEFTVNDIMPEGASAPVTRAFFRGTAVAAVPEGDADVKE